MSDKYKYTMSINNAFAIYAFLHLNSYICGSLSKREILFAKRNNHLFDVKPMTFWEWKKDQGIKFTEEHRGFTYNENGPVEAIK